MNSPKKIALGVFAFAVLLTILSGLFTVDQREQVIVMQFGEPKKLFSVEGAVIRDPGLYLKLPFIQNVVHFDKRILDLDPPPEEMTLSDKKRINVDAFARYKIVDPLRFYQALRTEEAFRDQVGRILNSSVRDAVASHTLIDLLSDKRVGIMEQIKNSMVEAAQEFGIEIVDVRIGRTDLPEQISKNVYDRMRSEREREANELRAEGEELKLKIVAEADRDKTVMLAEARRTSAILRGEGEGRRNEILGQAYGQDPEFFAFYRSMQAYREALKNGDTNLVLSPDSDFFRFFGDQSGKLNTKP